MDISHLLNTQVSILRKTRVSDGQGGYTENYAPLYTNIWGRISAPVGSDIEIAGREEARVTKVLYLAPEVILAMNDRVTSAGRTYRVTVPDLPASIRIYTKALMVEIQN